MVISPYNTLFAANPASNAARADAATGIQSVASANYDLNEGSKQQQTRRPVTQAETPNPTVLFIKQNSFAEQASTETVEREGAHQYGKVQTFISIREFEDNPQIIDTFV